MSSKATLPLFFLLLLFSTHLSLSLSYHSCNQDDRKTLLKLRDYFGPDDDAFRNWGYYYDCCSWNGVGCNKDGRVNFLSIQLCSEIPKTLLGIPSDITDFSDHLKHLKLSSSSYSGVVITGPIPRVLAQLYELEHLDLSNNRFNGTIPGFIGDTFKENLKYLDLSNNELSGNVTQTLGFYEKLTTLKLNNNQLSGLIPTNFNQIKTLEYLDLSCNKLSGPIDPTLSNLTNLCYIDFHDNKLNGTIPEDLGKLWSLDYFDVRNNQLCGKIPDSLLWVGARFFSGNKCLCVSIDALQARDTMETIKNKENYVADNNRVVFTV